MRHGIHYVKLGAILTLLAVVLAACGTREQSTQPTAGAPGTAQPQPTAQPTAKPQPRPTGQPAPTATAQPQRNPIIGFNPQGGAAGTVVNVFGSGYVPGAPVKVRLGLPTATGEVLASAFAGADGSWSASLTIPERLPSGEVISGDNMFLVAMDDQNIALASAPFAFVPAGPAPQPTLAQARQTVADLLSAWAVGNMDGIPALLAQPMRDEVKGGRALFQVLGMQGDTLDSFEVREPQPSEIMLVPATLHYHSFDDSRFYHLVIEDGRWKIAGTSAAQAPQPEPPADALAAVNLLMTAVEQDRTLRNGQAAYYLGGPLRDSVASGKLGGAGALLKEEHPFNTYRVDRVMGSDQENTYVEATLFYGANDTNGAGRIFTVSNREEGIWRIFKITPSDEIGKPDAGSGWLAAVRGDFNQDGLEETVWVLPSNVTAVDTFPEDRLRAKAIVITQLVIEQPGAHGPWPMLSVDRVGVTADKALGSFVSDAAPHGPEAFVLALDPAQGPFVNLLPIKADGTAYAQGIALNWNADEHAYRLVGGPHGN
jgi:hypothetical protein